MTNQCSKAGCIIGYPTVNLAPSPPVSIDMTAYVANHEKKKRIFEKRERELLHAIKHCESSERLALAAEKLRAAKVNVFKCRFSANRPVQPHNFDPEEAAQTNPELAKWLSMTSEEIVALYKSDE